MTKGLRFRGPGRRSLRAKNQKVSKKSRKKSPGPGSQKSEKSLDEGPKSLPKPIFRLFLDFSDLRRDFFRTFGARLRETFFETFLRLFGFWPRDSFSQVHGTSTKGWFQKKGWFWWMFPRNENRNEGMFACSPEENPEKRVRSHVAPERKLERGCIRQNHPFTKPPFYLPPRPMVYTLFPCFCQGKMVYTIAFFAL